MVHNKGKPVLNQVPPFNEDLRDDEKWFIPSKVLSEAQLLDLREKEAAKL
jgi:hypothetical protein